MGSVVQHVFIIVRILTSNLATTRIQRPKLQAPETFCFSLPARRTPAPDRDRCLGRAAVCPPRPPAKCAAPYARNAGGPLAVYARGIRHIVLPAPRQARGDARNYSPRRSRLNSSSLRMSSSSIDAAGVSSSPSSATSTSSSSGSSATSATCDSTRSAR